MKKDNEILTGLLEESLEKVGRERDHAVMDGIGGMSREEFAAMIEQAKGEDSAEKSETEPKRKRPKVVEFIRRNATYLRLAAACIVVALAIYGINDWKIAQPYTNVHASMFEQYYKVDDKLMQQYKNEGKAENAWGGKSTAAILEEASRNITSDSRYRVRQGIRQLERLRDNPKCRRSLKHEVHWYLGLGYLKTNRTKAARTELELVIELNSYHSADAREIIKRL